MATKAYPNKDKPKDNKQILLDLISQQYGPKNAMVMEEAFKNESGQIKEAMTEGGKTSTEIANSIGIDLEGLNNQIKTQLSSPNQENNSQESNFLPAKGLLSPAQQLPTGQIQEGGALSWIGGHSTSDLLKKILYLSQIQKSQMGDESPSLIAQREANTELMRKQIESMDTNKGIDMIFRDPVTGNEVSPEQAQKDMQEGLGVYQINQRVVTRSGVQEKPLNRVPDLTQEEKKYVNDAERIGTTLSGFENNFNNLYQKFGKSNWQSFQIEKVPYILINDQDVQSLKDDLTRLKADIPFLRGGKNLTVTEGKRVDSMLNPFGKTKETYAKDIESFKKEFLTGKELMKFGVNAGLMERLVKSKITKSQDKYKIGQTITKDGKTYTYKGDNQWSY